jgi:hypothetical protein
MRAVSRWNNRAMAERGRITPAKRRGFADKDQPFVERLLDMASVF